MAEHKKAKRFIVPVLALLSVAAPVVLTINPVVLPLPLPDGNCVAVWKSEAVHRWRWILHLLAILWPALCYLLGRRLQESKTDPLSRVLFPLCFMPLTIPAILLAGTLPLSMTANIIFFLPVVLCSAAVARFMRPLWFLPITLRPLMQISIAIVAAILYAWYGYHLSCRVGPHAGDEVHYALIANSLHHDGRLDLQQAIERKLGPEAMGMTDPKRAAGIKRRVHISRNAKDGRWYSTHSIGLSLLLVPTAWGNLEAPFGGSSLLARHITLGIIAAMGCLGMLCLAARLVPPLTPGSIFLVTTLALSNVWMGYAARCLPEVLGATLLCWAFWGICSQKERPWLSVPVTAICCTYMLWVHVRFIPLSLLAFGFYGLAGLFNTGETWPRRILRMSIFSLLCGAGFVSYYCFQSTMFMRGCSYSLGTYFLAYPLGIWYSLADTRGLFHILPVFFWCLAAAIMATLRQPRLRFFAIAIMVLFAVDLILCCATSGWSNGGSLPGKKLVVLLPLFLPAAIAFLPQVNRVALGWFIFLCVLTLAYMLGAMQNLDILGAAAATRGPLVLSRNVPLLLDLFDPHAQRCPALHAAGPCMASTAWCILTTLLSVAILYRPSRQRLTLFAVTIIILSGIALHLYLLIDRGGPDVSPTWRERALAGFDLARVHVAATPQTSLSQEEVLGNQRRLFSLTTEDLGEIGDAGLISQPYVPINDWAGRSFRWTDLLFAFRSTKGIKTMTLEGVFEGTGTPVFALRIGSDTPVETALKSGRDGRIRATFTFFCRGGKRDIHALLRIEGGNGVFTGDKITWMTGGPHLATQLGLTPAIP